MNLEVVKDYYGKVLKSSKDLKTSACCDGAGLPPHLQPLLANVHPEVPPNITAAASSCRRSSKAAACSISAQAQGATSTHGAARRTRGEVVGVDMTDEQLATANAHIDWHRERFGYERGNVKFLKGYIEKLDELDSRRKAST